MTMPATVKSQTQQKQTVQQAAEKLQPNFDRYVREILQAPSTTRKTETTAKKGA